MPFNVVLCNECRTVQTKYLGNPNIIYASNHNESITIILGGSSDYRNELMVEKKGVEVILLDSI
jgi:hypothetical protein